MVSRDPIYIDRFRAFGFAFGPPVLLRTDMREIMHPHAVLRAVRRTRARRPVVRLPWGLGRSRHPRGRGGAIEAVGVSHSSELGTVSTHRVEPRGAARDIAGARSEAPAMSLLRFLPYTCADRLTNNPRIARIKKTTAATPNPNPIQMTTGGHHPVLSVIAGAPERNCTTPNITAIASNFPGFLVISHSFPS
jgi:hypothetical protein